MEPLFKVPIRNLFCLLSYVNDMPELIESLNDIDEDLITYDFIAKRFLNEVETLKRRGFVKNYIAITESTNRLSGRLLINESLPYIITNKPVVVCKKDVYTENILLNKVMKATLKGLCYNSNVKEETRKISFQYLEQIPEVDTLPLSKEIFTRIYFARHNLHYKRMVHIARILHELTLLSHKQGNWSLFSAVIDEKSLNHIFEKFLFQFYRIEQKIYRVSSDVMQWKLEGNQSLLPTMRTDISLTHKKIPEKIIIDAKFYKNIFQENYGKSSFHSHNMYQLFTYLMHQSQELVIRGILIYPYNGVEIEEKYRWSNRVTFEVMTLNLDDSWKDVYAKMISIVNKEEVLTCARN